MELCFWGGGSFLTAHRQSSLQESRGLEFKLKQVQQIRQMNSREASGLRAQQDQVTVLRGAQPWGGGLPAEAAHVEHRLQSLQEAWWYS